MKHSSEKILFVLLAFLLSSCTNEIKFDKAKWDKQPDLGFTPPYRNKMLPDLTKNYKLVGLKYSQLIELLGKPNFVNKNSLGYAIIIDYGHDIDPIYTKSLYFTISKDSLTTSLQVDEWQK